ncbi:unnamed protein product [Caenorhabditis brenneri]
MATETTIGKVGTDLIYTPGLMLTTSSCPIKKIGNKLLLETSSRTKTKKLEKKDAQIQESLAKVASLKAVTQENAHIRAKLHEFGDLEAKKQGLELQESDFEISKLVKAEAENLKDQLEESKKNTERKKL